jgi:hypothetical protein
LQGEFFIFTNTMSFIVTLLQETFYSLQEEIPKFLYFFFLCFSFIPFIYFNFSLFVSISLSCECETNLYWQLTQIHFLNWYLCLGFWNVTNTWEMRWRKSKYFFTWNDSIEIQWKITNKVIKFCVWLCVFRQKVELVQFVGWHLNRLQTEITARNQMFGHLELSVQFSIDFNSIFSLCHNLK